MKLFLGIALLLAMLLTTARAQQDADARYVAIYNIIQQADNLADGGQPSDALNAYTDAQTRLEKFSKVFPNWDTGIIAYRLGDLEKKIAALKIQTAPKKIETPVAVAAGNDNSTKFQSEVSELEVQLQTAQLENKNLQGKLI